MGLGFPYRPYQGSKDEGSKVGGRSSTALPGQCWTFSPNLFNQLHFKLWSDLSSSGCFFWLVPPRKVLSMELVPPNRKNYQVHWSHPRHKRVQVVKNSDIFCVLGGTSVSGFSNFFCWGGPVPYLELFWVGPVKINTLYHQVPACPDADQLHPQVS